MAAIESVPKVENNVEVVTEKIEESIATTTTVDGEGPQGTNVTTESGAKNQQDGVETKAAIESAIAEIKSITEDPIAWISAQKPAVIHKVNSIVCNWITGLVNEGSETPIVTAPGKNDTVTKNQFLAFLKDGTVLAHFANKISPGSVETVHEGENAQVKENQTSNIEGFIKFAKEKFELPEEHVFSVADIQEKGKEGYQAVFDTLTRIGMSIKDKFEKEGLDIDSITESAAKVTQNKIFVTLLGLFNRAKAALTAKKSVGEKTADGKDKVTAENGEDKKEDAEATTTKEGDGTVGNEANKETEQIKTDEVQKSEVAAN
uniref:Calponin-homology (CH) domain-containing protein n=1 Tax=Strongyloides venezuelensis TaxID=75913 RepID=A0A0K0EYU7_STRVS